MNSEEFVKAVKLQTSDAAVDGTIKCLKRPPGRKPAERLLRLTDWYNQLPEKDQEMLRIALREAAEMAVFEFLCALDGVSAIENGRNKGELELYFVKSEERTRLNDPNKEELHNLFNALCSVGPESHAQNSEVSAHDQGCAADLKSKLKSGDGLDVHHVPDKYTSLQTVKDYDPNRAPAVALPKSEHRQVLPKR
jgi:hypothetical protein